MLFSDDTVLRLAALRQADLIRAALARRQAAACSGPGWAQRTSWAIGRLCITLGERLLASAQCDIPPQPAFTHQRHV